MTEKDASEAVYKVEDCLYETTNGAGLCVKCGFSDWQHLNMPPAQKGDS